MIESIVLLALLGLGVGAIGTLIGAGGGFILVPVLILLYPEMKPEEITAVSLAIVAANALTGSMAYIRSKRVDFKAGLIFAAATIPGSILGVFATNHFDRSQFDLAFGFVLLALAIFLFVKGGKKKITELTKINPKYTYQTKTDRDGNVYEYSYNMKLGIVIALFIGFFSPLFGIGGGVIHVPAMTEILHFPVHIATSTSQFILGIMSLVSVITHYFQGSYDSPEVLKLIGALLVGIIPGSLIGARVSKMVKGTIIIKVLSFALGIIGLKILYDIFM